jgi:hypothetical protein
MKKADLNNKNYLRLETLGRKDGVMYLKKIFAGRNDVLIQTIDMINRPTILISIGRSQDALQKLDNQWVKTVIRIDPKKITGLEQWSEDTGTFYYVSSSLTRAIDLAENLAERGDAIFFAPKSYDNNNSGIYLEFNQKVESMLA